MEIIKLPDVNVQPCKNSETRTTDKKKRKYEHLDLEETDNDDEEANTKKRDFTRYPVTESIPLKGERKIALFLPNTVPQVDIAFLPSKDLIKGYLVLNEKNSNKQHYFLIPEPLVSLGKHELIDYLTFYPKESELASSAYKPRFLVVKLQPVLPVRKTNTLPTYTITDALLWWEEENTNHVQALGYGG